MRSSRASLFLMELMISILFFSLSSAVCIQLFVKAHAINETTEDISKATLIAQDICEYFHYANGKLTAKWCKMKGGAFSFLENEDDGTVELKWH